MALSVAILVQAPARGTAMGCGASSGGASSGGGLLAGKPASDDKDWEELTSAEQEAATTLGFNASSWDGDQKGPYDNSDFNELPSAQQEAVRTLGWTPGSWDAS